MQRHVCLSHTQLRIKTVGKNDITTYCPTTFLALLACVRWMGLSVTLWCCHSPDFHVNPQLTLTRFYPLPVDTIPSCSLARSQCHCYIHVFQTHFHCLSVRYKSLLLCVFSFVLNLSYFFQFSSIFFQILGNIKLITE